MQMLFCERKIMTQISRRSLFGAAAAASVLPVASGLAAFSPIAAAAAAMSSSPCAHTPGWVYTVVCF